MFQISHQTILTLSWSLSQTILHTFLDIKQYWHFQRVTGEQYYRIYIKQCCYFQRVPSKWNYSNVQSTYHTILTLSDSYYQTILTYSELISSSIHTSTELLLNNSKHFLEFLNGHLNRQKILKAGNSQLKVRKVGTDNVAIDCSWVYMIGWLVIDGFMGVLSPPSPIQNVPKKFEILPVPSYNIQKNILAPQYHGK